MRRSAATPAVWRPVMGVLALALLGLSMTPGALAQITGGVEADSVQDGDNRFSGGQDNSIGGGDASAGSNIVGSAGRGETTIDVQNTSNGADAETGDLELTTDLSSVHVGEKTSADQPEPEAPQEEIESQAIGPLGPLGPGEAPEEDWWGTNVLPTGETSSTEGAGAGPGEDVSAAAAPSETVVAAEFGSAAPGGPLAMGEESAVLAAAGEGDPLGQVTGPPGPTGPAGPLDLDVGGEQSPSQVVPTPQASAPAVATPSPQREVQSEDEDSLPVNGAYIQTFATIATVLTAIGLLLTALSRIARLRRLAADLVAP